MKLLFGRYASTCPPSTKGLRLAAISSCRELATTQQRWGGTTIRAVRTDVDGIPGRSAWAVLRGSILRRGRGYRSVLCGVLDRHVGYGPDRHFDRCQATWIRVRGVRPFAHRSEIGVRIRGFFAFGEGQDSLNGVGMDD